MCMCWECSTSVGEWKLIEYKICHSLIWKDGKDQDETWLWRTVCKCEGQSSWGAEVRVEGFVLADQRGNNEENQGYDRWTVKTRWSYEVDHMILGYQAKWRYNWYQVALDEVKMEESHAMENDQGGVSGHTWMIILHHMKMEVGYSWGVGTP